MAQVIINPFDRITLLEAMEFIPAVNAVFLDTFFADVAPHDTNTIQVDRIKGKRRMASFADPEREAPVVKNNGFVTQTITLPYIKEKIKTSALDVINRQAGTTIYEKGKSPMQRASEKMAKDFLKLKTRIVRRKEWMAINSIVDGTLHLVGEGVDITIDFKKLASHHASLTGATTWDETTATIEKNVREWCKIVKKDSGVKPVVAFVGSKVADAILDSEELAKKLDNRRKEVGRIMPDYNPEGASYIGTFAGIDWYEYISWFTDETTDEETELLSDRKIILGSPKAICEVHYGAILDLKANYAVQYFADTIIKEDPSCAFALLQSAPLTIPMEIDAFFTAEVLEAP